MGEKEEPKKKHAGGRPKGTRRKILGGAALETCRPQALKNIKYFLSCKDETLRANMTVKILPYLYQEQPKPLQHEGGEPNKPIHVKVTIERLT